MIVFIPQSAPQSNWAAEVCAPEWLPRICPRCGQTAVIGHGRRSKAAHDERHTRIRIRRGICNHCGQTITVLPVWSVPYAHYTLRARAHAVYRFLEEGRPLEACAPPTRDVRRVADPATLRRWFQRGVVSGWACAEALRRMGRAAGSLAPTMFAWDWLAAAHMLVPEAQPT